MNVARLVMVMRRELINLLAKYDNEPEIITIDGKPVVNLSEKLIDGVKNDVDNFLRKYHIQQLITDTDWLLSWENENFKFMRLEVTFTPYGERNPVCIAGTIVIKPKEKDNYKDAWNRAMQGI